MPTVRDIMSTRLATIEATAPLLEAAREMHERSIGAVLVMANERVAGILTERDLLHCVATTGVESATVADWMTRDPEMIEPSDTTSLAA
jgi:CBS domain-containing protein